MTTATIDPKKVHAFADTSGLTTTILAALGDRLGPLKVLAAQGPAQPRLGPVWCEDPAARVLFLEGDLRRHQLRLAETLAIMEELSAGA